LLIIKYINKCFIKEINWKEKSTFIIKKHKRCSTFLAFTDNLKFINRSKLFISDKKTLRVKNDVIKYCTKPITLFKYLLKIIRILKWMKLKMISIYLFWNWSHHWINCFCIINLLVFRKMKTVSTQQIEYWFSSLLWFFPFVLIQYSFMLRYKAYKLLNFNNWMYL